MHESDVEDYLFMSISSQCDGRACVRFERGDTEYFEVRKSWIVIEGEGNRREDVGTK